MFSLWFLFFGPTSCLSFIASATLVYLTLRKLYHTSTRPTVFEDVILVFGIADIIQCLSTSPGEYHLCSFRTYMVLFGAQVKASLGALSSILLWRLVTAKHRFNHSEAEHLFVYMVSVNVVRIILFISFNGASIFCPHKKNEDIVQHRKISISLILTASLTFLLIALDVILILYYSFKTRYYLNLQSGDRGLPPSLQPVVKFLFLISGAALGECPFSIPLYTP
jgi:hypothetical protein